MKVSKLRARTSMRHLAGEDIPRADTTSFGMRNAMKKAKRASGGVCMGEVDGESKRAPLNKAVMRRNCGGPVKRGLGGGLTDFFGGDKDKQGADSQQGMGGRKSGGRIKKADGGETVAPRARAPDDGAVTEDSPLQRAAKAAISGIALGAVGDSLRSHFESLRGVPADAKPSLADERNRRTWQQRKRGGRIGKDEGGALVEKYNAQQKDMDAAPWKMRGPDMRQRALTDTGVAIDQSGYLPDAPVTLATPQGNPMRVRSLDWQQGKTLPARFKSGGRAGKADGGPLDTKERNALSKKSFAGPDRSYPINDENHARNALSRVSQFGSPGLKSRVRGAVARKFPGIGK